MNSIMMRILLLVSLSQAVLSFAPTPRRTSANIETNHHLDKVKQPSSFVGSSVEHPVEAWYDPLGFSSKPSAAETASVARAGLSAASVLAPLTLWAQDARAETSSAVFPTVDFNPANFNPVCPASDGLYRILQGSTEAIVGKENFVEYGPLIAGGLLRIRLEICVVESFFNEAVGPFIAKNGLNWILPLHETVETFLAGSIFALASTFILVGSTKIVSVIVTYADVFLGAPARLLGTFFFDRARGKPVTLDIGFGPFKTRIVGPPDEKIEEETNPGTNPLSLYIILVSGTVKTAGEISRFLRDFFEGLDLFVGRYLVLIATGYIGLKFLHFKVFPDFPPF